MNEIPEYYQRHEQKAFELVKEYWGVIRIVYHIIAVIAIYKWISGA